MALPALFYFQLLTPVTQNQPLPPPVVINLDADPCTLSQLQTAFSTTRIHPSARMRKKSSKQSPPESSSTSCWSLDERVIRIPVSAIVHRDDSALVPLGQGRKGCVHKAIIRLSLSVHSADSPQCSVAIKTDMCFVPEHFWDFGAHHVNDVCVSCVRDGTFLVRPHSYLGAEYTGTLLQYARDFVVDNDEKEALGGLLPTWGVLTNVDYPLRHRWAPRWLWAGAPHPDPSIVGVVMPLRPFQPLDHRPHLSLPNSVAFCRLFLPAARGLQFAADRLGFAYQDIKEKNIGIVEKFHKNNTIITSFIFDNGMAGLQTPLEFSHPVSNVCHEAAFPPADRQKDWYNNATDSLQSDFLHFREILSRRTRDCPGASRTKALQHAILSSSTLSELVLVLERCVNSSSF